MRALVIDGEQGTCALAHRPDPECGPTEVLVEVRAAGLNRGDLLMRLGKYAPTGANWNVAHDRLGYDMAGTVRVVGASAHGVHVEQAVMAMVGGACADLVAVDHRLLLPVPDGLDWVRAAALPAALATEYDALAVRGRLRAGDVVLVTGGATGIGLVGIQLARAFGAATVITTTRDAGKAPLLRELGADVVVDTAGESPFEVIRDATQGHGFDVCLDHVGGRVLEQAVAAAATNARIVQIGRLAGTLATVDLDQLAKRRVELIGTTFRGRRMPELAKLTSAVRDKVLPLVAKGSVRPVIEAEFPISRAEDAMALLRTTSTTGKVVLTGLGRTGTGA
jgi:NADPH2:quinone reductase